MEDRLEVGLQSSFEGITRQESTLKPLPLCRCIYLIQYPQTLCSMIRYRDLVSIRQAKLASKRRRQDTIVGGSKSVDEGG